MNAIVPTVTVPRLSKLCKSFKKRVVDLEDYPELPQYCFSQDPLIMRIVKLAEVKESRMLRKPE
jgi:hypothetical protein